jgi:hypothetical protein
MRVREVVPKWVYADANNAALLDGTVNKIIVPMCLTGKEGAVNRGYIDSGTWEQGMADIEKSGIPPDGMFFYTWFKAVSFTERAA